jgi:ataxin-10
VSREHHIILNFQVNNTLAMSDESFLNARFCEICAGFLGRSGKDSVPSLTRALDTIASDLARNEDLR